MAEDPMEKLLHQVGEIFKIIEEGKTKDFEKNITPEITARLENLKELFDQFNEANRQVFEEAGSSIQALQKIVQSPPDTLEIRWRKLFEFSKNLRNDLERSRLQNNLSADTIRKDQPFDQAKQMKDEVRKRQKKFKQMGGGQDYMRL